MSMSKIIKDQSPKMMSTGQYSETSSGDMYLDNRYLYARNSKAIGVLWAVFSLCFAIINMVVFVQPQWLGDTATSRGTGYFGLWRSCRLLQDGQDLICEGRLDDFSTIQTPAFRAATVFVGLSVFLSSLCVLSMVLFFFLHSSTVFHVCGWIQLSCAISMLVGVLIFPIGWDTPIVREVCGNDSDSYSLGQCGIRWAFILALIGVIDSIVLSILAFVLGSRYVKLLPDHYLPNGTKYKGEVNSAFMNPEYLPNKKLIGSLQNQMISKSLHGSLSSNGLSPGYGPLGSLNHHHHHNIHPHHHNENHHPNPHSNHHLNEMERYSDYSQRTNRSSYKSSTAIANLHHHHHHHPHVTPKQQSSQHQSQQSLHTALSSHQQHQTPTVASSASGTPSHHSSSSMAINQYNNF
ncbi:LHFPL tetraspan subfamily member 3 protein-like [Dermatophagoides pteronyssinus]|uniref:LHFPL tetraspan subfamily member 4 protein-like n=1 Tax=Dermatophagoides pteronyssinus TaxID=6956 RepID=A0A6P6XQD8_DERPT|nr:LHFPL tetraspan subfamily member 4 protein-like [Dermatophagoides pteronyssinus]